MTKLIGVAIFFFMAITIISGAIGADYRNFYGITWRGSACENIDYAKSMGYDFVIYQSGMENCANNRDIGFYLEAPDTQGFPDDIKKIDLQNLNLLDQIRGDNNFYLWKSNSAFPYNLATGWFFDPQKFNLLPDFQRQEIIDRVAQAALNTVIDKENTANNFYFAGYAWDVPTIEGDLWSKAQSLGGRQTTIRYWTSTDSGIQHPGESYQYSTYRDGQAAFRKKLYYLTKQRYPDMKVLMEPNLAYENYIKQIENRADKLSLKPDMLCQEEANPNSLYTTFKFLNDTRIFASGLITKDKMCSSTPKVFDHILSLRIAANAALNKAWFAWYGRFGGGGDMPDYGSVRDVPARLKLIRAMVGWDNLNSAWSRSWDEAKLQYSSSHSFADKYVIYSRHPENRLIYAVVLDKNLGRIRLNRNEAVVGIYRSDSLYRKGASASADFNVVVGSDYTRLYLKDSVNHGRGYIIEVRTQ